MGRKMSLPYLNRYRVRGREFAYYRRGGRNIRIGGDPGTAQWLDSYNRIHAGFERGSGDGTLSELIGKYRASPEFTGRAPRTRHDYERMLAILDGGFGHLRVATMPREFVYRLRDKYAATPRKANYLIAMLSILFNFAVERGWRPDNPMHGFKGRLREGPGHRPWTADEVEGFLEAAPLPIYRAAMMALCTGQRQGDVLRMVWSQYDGEAIEVIQGKTGERLWIPAHRDLKAMLAGMDRAAAVILTTTTGLAWNAGHFKKEFRLAVGAAGMEGIVFHGLRKTATAMLADAGCTEREIMDITGHRTAAMVSLYVRGSQRKKRARAAIRKLESGTKLPNRSDKSA